VHDCGRIILARSRAGLPPGAVPGAPTIHGTIHTVAAYTIFFALAAGCFVLASRFATAPNWRGWATYSVVTGVVILVFFALFPATYGSGPPAGLFERVSALAHALWSCLIVAALLFQSTNKYQQNRLKT
jgi:hypothetical protein